MASDSSRDWAPLLKVIAAALLIATTLGLVIWRAGSRPTDQRLAYYLDLESQRLFTAPVRAVPPIPTPDQDRGRVPEGVRAFVFTCDPPAADYTGLTADELAARDAFIGWLEKYTPEGQQILSGDLGADADFETGLAHKLIGSPDGSAWFPAESPGAAGLRARVFQRCDDGSPTLCEPGVPE